MTDIQRPFLNDTPTPDQVKLLIKLLAPAESLDPDIITKQCAAESGFRPFARNPVSGAYGLMQLMERTAQDEHIDRSRWHENLFGAIRYMGKLHRMFGEDVALALAAYNWGCGHVDTCRKQYGERWREHVPAETELYLTKILGA